MKTPSGRFAGGMWLTAAACAALSTRCAMPERIAVAEIDGLWQEPVELVLPNADTVGCYDWQLFVRGNERLAADRFSLQITVLTPDSLRFSEPVTMQLPAPAATPLLREASIDYRRRVRLAAVGNYRVRIAPAQPTAGIDAVGIQIVKTEN